MLDSLLDALLDTLKLLPYLFITFIILEFIEHKISNKNMKILSKNKKYGPLLGGMLGAIPQCGFSGMAANLFSNHIISIGTLIAVFLSTSDEMLPLMISNEIEISKVLAIILPKALIGIVFGFIVDLFYKRKDKENKLDIPEMCEKDHCHCNESGILVSSILHTLKIGLFVLIANLLINVLIYYIGEDSLANLLLTKNILSYFIASLVGLLPNCASSIIITELYLENLITIGNLFAGLLTGSGIGILLLFRTNKNFKENILVLSIIYFIGVFMGIIIDLII